MSLRTDIECALDGGTPERTPLTVCDWLLFHQQKIDIREDHVTELLRVCLQAPEWQRLLDRGLGICHHVPVIRAIEHGVRTVRKTRHEGSARYDVVRKETPIGAIQMVTCNGWHHEPWIKEPGDYEVQRWIIQNTELLPNDDAYDRALNLVGHRGVVIQTGHGCWQSRSPAMRINVDMAGTQQFCLDVALAEEALSVLYEELKRQFLAEVAMIAKMPGRYVKWLENLTISMLGPRRYADMLVNVYCEAMPIYVQAGKRVMVHYDGALQVIADQIAQAPFDCVESLTEPPEGDLLYDECRRLWPDKVLWGNINVDLYARGEAVLKQSVRDKCHRAGRRAFLLEISEDLPGNFDVSVPWVLEALAE